MKKTVTFVIVILYTFLFLLPTPAYAVQCPITTAPSPPLIIGDPRTGATLPNGYLALTGQVGGTSWAGGSEYYIEMCKGWTCNILPYQRITNLGGNSTSFNGNTVIAKVLIGDVVGHGGTYKFRITRDDQAVCEPVSFEITESDQPISDPGTCPPPVVSSPRSINDNITISVDATNIFDKAKLYITTNDLTTTGALYTLPIPSKSGIQSLTIPAGQLDVRQRYYAMVFQDRNFGDRLCKTSFSVTSQEDETSSVLEPYDPGCTPGDTENVKTALGCLPTNPESFVNKALPWAIGIGAGIAFLLGLFGSGMIVLSAGNPEKMQAGKEMITSAIGGIIIIVFAVFLLDFIGVKILKLFAF